ncbi:MULTISPECIES: serine/threonine-protein kinase [unclassified Leptolyngbya]|uniref:serine/threonine protein kinase n=1 Tax=unclassified Leptolyngbya TaxID=2650499 RepID=UPI0016866C3F|nr:MULTISPECIES: serine/threonine-protein kinase [unclassified Leptolyngbya]MBD1913397.1 protein kinase [Leptolyngbya sp. FACHB-8]MBD2158672.1 protein kinase [Leptolyngbya sp. FACHB-16]
MISPGTLLHQRYSIIRLLGSGGMSEVFEVCDQQAKDHPIKVLKLLKEDSPDLIKRLQQEAEVLQRLPHPGIPWVSPEDGYFCEQVPGFPEPLHYLVMEKVPGETLQEWLKTTHPLSEAEAIAYLKQLVEILDHIHHANFLHRDIKPSNIIRKPDGKLVLIDFGISREMTETYHKKLQQNVTGTYHLFTRGYAPAEQMDGRAVPQSDFFALGRTLVYALTQTPIADLPTAKDAISLQWQSAVPGISSNFARLLDSLMAPIPTQRPKNTQEILRAIALLERELTPRLRLREVPWVVLLSMTMATLCLGIRGNGWMQPLELKALDAMMQLRPAEVPDLPGFW